MHIGRWSVGWGEISPFFFATSPLEALHLGFADVNGVMNFLNTSSVAVPQENIKNMEDNNKRDKK